MPMPRLLKIEFSEMRFLRAWVEEPLLSSILTPAEYLGPVIELCETRRGEVIRYVQERYGHDKVAQIITFGKLKARAVTVGHGLGDGQTQSTARLLLPRYAIEAVEHPLAAGLGVESVDPLDGRQPPLSPEGQARQSRVDIGLRSGERHRVQLDAANEVLREGELDELTDLVIVDTAREHRGDEPHVVLDARDLGDELQRRDHVEPVLASGVLDLHQFFSLLWYAVSRRGSLPESVRESGLSTAWK